MRFKLSSIYLGNHIITRRYSQYLRPEQGPPGRTNHRLPLVCYRRFRTASAVLLTWSVIDSGQHGHQGCYATRIRFHPVPCPEDIDRRATCDFAYATEAGTIISISVPESSLVRIASLPPTSLERSCRP